MSNDEFRSNEGRNFQWRERIIIIERSREKRREGERNCRSSWRRNERIAWILEQE